MIDFFCVHQLFERRVDQHPGDVAVRFGNQTISYEDLNRRANQIAHRLVKDGVGPGVNVGVCLERSIDMIAAILAVLKTGGVYVPLDASFPADRLKYMIGDSDVAVILTQSRYLDQFSRKHRLFVVDEENVADESNSNPDVAVGAKDLVYLTYTSGSTGRPKGIEMPHGPLANLIQWQFTASRLGPGSAIVQYAALSFDVSSNEIFSALCFGGELLLIEESLRFDALGLIHEIRRVGATRLTLSYVPLQLLCKTALEHNVFPDSLNEIISTGEQLKITSEINSFFEFLPTCRLRNEYGPSEAHTVANFTLPSDVSSWSSLPPIGRPIANVELYILDDQLKPVPAGQEGDLYIGGEMLATGYRNLPELTQKYFLTDPFRSTPGARMYKTGDTCRYRHDGEIEFVGRTDSQVKIRGQRIELGEIEAVLSEHKQILQCVVSVVGERAVNQELVAHIVCQSDIAEKDIRAYLVEKLPGYMVPSRFIRLEAFPLLPNGKINRRVLRELEASVSEPVGESTESWSKTEIQLLRIWSEVLSRNVIGNSDNFFDIGGNSLLSMRILNRIRHAFEIEIELRLVFEAQTIKEMARLIDSVLSAGTSRSSSTLTTQA